MQDREMKGDAAQVSRTPGAMVGARWSGVDRYQSQQGGGTRSAALRRAFPEKQGRVSSGPVSTGPACRSAVSRSPEPIGLPGRQPRTDESRGTWAGLAGRTRNEEESEQLAPEEERHEELSLIAMREDPLTHGTQPGTPIRKPAQRNRPL